MFKNVASQKVTLFVIDTATNLPKTGDAANLTLYVSKDDGSVTALGDTSATELDSTNALGLYTCDLTQAETNGDKLLFTGKSSTSGVRVVPLLVYSVPAGWKVPATIAAGDLANDSITAAALASDAGTEIGTAVWATTTRLLTAGTNIALAKGTGVTGFNDLSAAQVNAECDTALSDVGVTLTVTGRIDAAISTRLATAGYTAPLDAAGVRTAVGLATANLDTQLDALPTAAENTTAVWGAGTRVLTAGTNIALAKGTGVTGFNDPTAAAIADAVWDEAIAGHAGAGSTGEALGAAGSAGDPWTTALPGAYSAGQAGFIVGTNLDGTISSRASQTSLNTVDGIVDDILVDTGTTLPSAIAALPTDADVQTAAAAALTAYDPPTRTEATADKDAILAAVAIVDGNVDAVLVDTGTTIPGLIDGIEDAIGEIDGGGGGGGGSVEIVTEKVPVGEHYVETGDSLAAFRFQTFQLEDGVRVPHTYDDMEIVMYVDGVLSGTVPVATELSEGLFQFAASPVVPTVTAGQRLRIAVNSDDGEIEDETVWFGIVPAAGSGSGGGTVIGRYDDDDASSPNVTCKVGETAKTKSVTVQDSSGEPVDLTDWGDKVLIIERAGPPRTDVQVIDNAGITISGDDNETFTIQPSADVLEKPGDFKWSLREASSQDVIIDGRLTVSYSPMEDA